MQHIITLSRRAFTLFRTKHADIHAAAVAYYSVFAIIPLILFSITMVGYIFGQSYVADLLIRWGSLLVNDDMLVFIQGAVSNLEGVSVAGQLPIFGFIILLGIMLIGCNTLAVGLAQIWDVTEHGLWADVKRSGRSFLFICMVQLFIIGMILFENLISAIAARGGTIVGILEPIVYFAATTVLLGLGFRLLVWKSPPIWSLFIGSGVGTFLFLLIGKTLMWFHLLLSPVTNVYNAAGLLAVLLLWVFIIALFIFYGAAFARVHAEAKQEREMKIPIATYVVQS